MEGSNIEKYIADYLNGEISPEDMQQLNAKFQTHPELKEEADSLYDTWKVMDEIYPQNKVRETLDQKFYGMLEKEKLKIEPRMISDWLIRSPLKAAAAILLLVTGFGLGKFTVENKTVVSYKTVIVKDSTRTLIVKRGDESKKFVKIIPSQYSAVKITLLQKAKKSLPISRSRQLHSVFASDRLAAVSAIAKKKSFNDRTIALLAGLLNLDDNSNVRLAVIDVLRPMSTNHDVQSVLINTIKYQQDELVKSAIIELLISKRSKDALPVIAALLDDTNIDPLTQQQIKTGFESFAN